MTIRSPVEWAGAQMMHAAHALGSVGRALDHVQETMSSPAPAVRIITLDDVADAVKRGFADFAAYRSDVFFLVILYPVVGLVLARLAFGMDLVPLLFPMASGFAIVGPFAALGLYEMSRRREAGLEVSWANGIDVLRRPAFGAILLLGVLLAAIFLLWLAVAWQIYRNTVGLVPLVSIGGFTHDVLATASGHAMIIVGIGVGYLFAVFAMTISVVSFPLLVDRDVGLDTAIKTSFRAVAANPLPMAGWGITVVAFLVLGSLPLFVGLIVAMPVLGHATWHLYRKLVVS